MSETIFNKTETDTLIGNFFDFVRKSPSPFHVVENISELLLKNGFSLLEEKEKWHLEEGKKYFVTRNSSSVIAFSLPKKKLTGFKICASHSDSPSFKIKENPEIKSNSYVTLNVEKYGGMLLSPWFDRPLSVAGRIYCKKGDSFEQRLVNIDSDLLMIPNLAIHMNREANDGHKINVQKEISPVFSGNESARLAETVAEYCGIDEKKILSSDLFLYCRDEPKTWGKSGEFISSPRLDDLECAFASSLALALADSQNEKSGSGDDFAFVNCVFDNEEVGSSTMQGAASTFLSDVLKRITLSLCLSEEDFYTILARSFMISADNAHALHPNFCEAADPVNRPKINGGVVIKFNASQKYTTDAYSAAVFKDLCARSGVPFQIYTNNSNIAGGSTLGNISQNHVSIPCVDIGLAQWAMHSPVESAGKKDLEYLFKALKTFFGAR